MAEFGTQDTGVFDKIKLDKATTFECYTYERLDYYQEERVVREGLSPNSYLYADGEKAPGNMFRTMGVEICPYLTNCWKDLFSQSAGNLLLQQKLQRLSGLS